MMIYHVVGIGLTMPPLADEGCNTPAASESLISRAEFHVAKTPLSILWDCDKSPAAFQRWLASYDYDTSPCVEDYNANSRRFKMRCLSAASFGTPVMHKFDILEVPMPQEWDKFLRCIFGPDYMTPPPPEKQVPSHIMSGML